MIGLLGIKSRHLKIFFSFLLFSLGSKRCDIVVSKSFLDVVSLYSALCGSC